jgi:hypothetical protein
MQNLRSLCRLIRTLPRHRRTLFLPSLIGMAWRGRTWGGLQEELAADNPARNADASLAESVSSPPLPGGSATVLYLKLATFVTAAFTVLERATSSMLRSSPEPLRASDRHPSASIRAATHRQHIHSLKPQGLNEAILPLPHRLRMNLTQGSD